MGSAAELIAHLHLHPEDLDVPDYVIAFPSPVLVICFFYFILFYLTPPELTLSCCLDTFFASPKTSEGYELFT